MTPTRPSSTRCQQFRDHDWRTATSGRNLSDQAPHRVKDELAAKWGEPA